MATKVRVEVFPKEHDAKVHAAKMKIKGYEATVERVESILWDASQVDPNSTSDEPTNNEMWLVLSRQG